MRPVLALRMARPICTPSLRGMPAIPSLLRRGGALLRLPSSEGRGHHTADRLILIPISRLQDPVCLVGLERSQGPSSLQTDFGVLVSQQDAGKWVGRLIALEGGDGAGRLDS